MMKITKMIVALFLVVLAGMAASSPATAQDQNIRVEAKRALAVSEKAGKIVNSAIKANDKLRADLRKTGRCIGKVLDNAPDSVAENQSVDLWIYSTFEAMRITEKATRKASRKAARVLVNAAESSSNPAIVNGLIAKADTLLVGSVIPSTGSCAVAQQWADNGYKGIRSLINKAYKKSGGRYYENAYKKMKRYGYNQDRKVNRASNVIRDVLGNGAGNRFVEDGISRSLDIFYSAMFSVLGAKVS